MDSLCRVRPTVGRSVRPSTSIIVSALYILYQLAAICFKYITMSEIYAVLVLWNITL